MRLIVIGSEYAGKTTLSVELARWMIRTMGLPAVRCHDHWVVPHLADQDPALCYLVGPAGRVHEVGRYSAPSDAAEVNDGAQEREKDIMALKPWVLEQLQRAMIWRHLHPSAYRDMEDNSIQVNFYYGEAVYAPLYYGYGEPGSFADRRRRARAWDAELMTMAPETVLVQVMASAEAIRRRMRESPRPGCILQEQDVEQVLDRFQEEYDSSLISRRLSLDTTHASVEESLQEFQNEVWPHLSRADRLRMVSKPG